MRYITAVSYTHLDVYKRQEGNLCYDYFMARDNKNQILLLEQWENQDVLDAHLKAPHMDALREIKDQYVESSKLQKFTAE